ncbi:nuclear transcription factor Y subunit alpha-like [Silurus meridionalis]|uniref:nuclear transcription factor Y subunit alpha-like n=1 Tax=Silurus meridionalis TaxID=175797 RepID=UPI001EEBF97D|nr:nuclear transcription factor Y subunit alpha-like [Silurus meridionalis]
MMEVSMKCWVIWTLCIAVILKTSASAGGESLERAEAMSAEDTFNYNFSFEIMNRIYNNSLQDPQSEDYKNMYKEVSSAFYSVYSCSSCPTFVGYQGTHMQKLQHHHQQPLPRQQPQQHQLQQLQNHHNSNNYHTIHNTNHNTNHHTIHNTNHNTNYHNNYNTNHNTN